MTNVKASIPIHKGVEIVEIVGQNLNDVSKISDLLQGEVSTNLNPSFVNDFPNA